MPFEMKISKSRFRVNDFSSLEMQQIAETLKAKIFIRLDQALTLYDQPAEPLKERYAKYKQRRGGSSVRDLKLTGETRRSINVLQVGRNTATIGPVKGYKQAWRLKAGKAAITYSQLLFIQNRRSPQWGVSRRDWEATMPTIQRLARKNVIAAKVA